MTCPSIATKVTCPECSRVFDLTNETDAAEWGFGHDCDPSYQPGVIRFQAQYSYSNTSLAGQPVWYDRGPATTDYDAARTIILEAIAEDGPNMPETAYRVAFVEE